MAANEQALLALLFLGHVVGDFVVQTERVATQKWRPRIVLEHGLLIFVTTLVLTIPLISLPLIAGLIVLALVHTLFDFAKAHAERRWNGSLVSFFADQGLHAASILLLWKILSSAGVADRAWLQLPTEWYGHLTRAGILLAGLAFNGTGGTVVVRKILARVPRAVPETQETNKGAHAVGCTIGILERLIVYALVILGQWAAVGLVFAAKSIARFREFKREGYASYYLIGTLCSFVVAIGSGLLVSSLLP